MKQLLLAAFLVALFAECSGARAQSSAMPAPSGPSLMMAQIHVAEMARSERFYREVFGMAVTHEVSPREHILRFSKTDISAPGLMLLLAGDKAPSNGGFLVQMPNIDAAFARVLAAGGKILRAPVDTPAGVRSGSIMDPDGTAIELMQYIRH